MIKHKWLFAPRFRYHAYGWHSEKPLLRVREAVIEIKQMAKTQPELAAVGAVLFLEKISPAIELIECPSASLYSEIKKAVSSLVPIIVKAKVDQTVRNRWLERLWEAIQIDQKNYIESLGYFWGDLCLFPEIASEWADDFLPMVERAWEPRFPNPIEFCGCVACLSALYAANRHEDLLNLLDMSPHPFWIYRQWGVKSLIAIGKKSKAVRYAEESKGLEQPIKEIALACEQIYLSCGLFEEAYKKYAILANQSNSHLTTLRIILKKYPQLAPADILRDLMNKYPDSERKWFTVIKNAGLQDLTSEFAFFTL